MANTGTGSNNTKTGAGVREPMHGPAGHRPASPPADQVEPVARPDRYDKDRRGAENDAWIRERRS